VNNSLGSRASRAGRGRAVPLLVGAATAALAVATRSRAPSGAAADPRIGSPFTCATGPLSSPCSSLPRPRPRRRRRPPTPTPTTPAPPAPTVSLALAKLLRTGHSQVALTHQAISVHGTMTPFVSGQKIVVRAQRGHKKVLSRR